MKKTLAVLNRMKKDGVIERYAGGGAIAATRYIEPIQTYDLYVFVFLLRKESGLVSLAPSTTILNGMVIQPGGKASTLKVGLCSFFPLTTH